MIELPLKRYRLNPRRPRLELTDDHLVMVMSNWFGSRRWEVPLDQVAHADLTDTTPGPPDQVVLDRQVRIPYFFSTAPVSAPTTALWFRTPQGMPRLRLIMALAPNNEVAGPIEGRRDGAVQVDAVLLRLHDPPSAHAALRAAGVEQVINEVDFLRRHRNVLQDPVAIESRVALGRRNGRRTRLGWGLVVAGGGACAAFIEGPDPQWAVAGAVVAALGAALLRFGRSAD